MRVPSVGGSIVRMPRHVRPTLILELDRADAETIAGRVSNDNDTAIEFVGWLGLAGAIEAALSGRPPASDPTDHNGGDTR